MPPAAQNDIEPISLELCSFAIQKLTLLSHAGSGGAGHVFKVRIDGQNYAWKLFKFNRGSKPEANCDPFSIECRANHALIQQDLNGRITPFCYGRLDVPIALEEHIARRFHIPLYYWEKPAVQHDHKIRGILFEWINGEILSSIPLTADMKTQAHTRLEDLHRTGIAHNDVRASNFLVCEEHVYLIDLSASITSPHATYSAREISAVQEDDTRMLEVGFFWLSQLSINTGAYVTDESCLQRSGMNVYDIASIKQNWILPVQQNKERKKPREQRALASAKYLTIDYCN